VHDQQGSQQGCEPPVRVMLVDDAGEVRWLIGLLVEDEAGWTVVGEAGDGAEAIVRAEQTRPDVVLLDMSMPVMDGLEALPHLRRVLPQALIVLVTAFPVAEVREVAVGCGADACLDKVDMATTLVPALLRLHAERQQARGPGAQPGHALGPRP
jgi:CheY-like chemotaxis protein